MGINFTSFAPVDSGVRGQTCGHICGPLVQYYIVLITYNSGMNVAIGCEQLIFFYYLTLTNVKCNNETF